MTRVLRYLIPAGTFWDVLALGAICVAAVLLAQLTYYGVPGTEAEGVLNSALVFAVLITLLSAVFGMFRPESQGGLDVVLARSLLVVVVGFPLAYLVFSAWPEARPARDTLGHALFYTVVAMMLVRLGGSLFVKSGMIARRVLIVGTDQESRRVESELARMGPNRFNVVGYYPTGDSPSLPEPANSQRRCFARDSDLLAIVRQNRVEEIVIAAGEQRGGALPMRQLLECRINGVPVHGLSTFFENLRGEVQLDSLKASWLIYGDGFVQDRYRTFVKRAFDVAFSSALLLGTLPVILLAALAIRIESGGSVLYLQTRVGRHGKVFRVIKLRSMRVDAELDGVARWASARDPRVTRIGRLIRSLRVDELPQLLNVLRGEMSLVGPRPERPGFVEELKTKVRFYDIRHCVKPGITGWAQVRYEYGASIEDAARKLQFDLYYVKNHSVVLDLLILIDTVRVVLSGQGSR